MNIIITGGNDGIGLELVKMLAAEGHRLGLVVRNDSKMAAFANITGAEDFTYFYADLADRDQVRQVIADIQKKFPVIDVLFNNAGIQLGALENSPQGNEMHFEVNVLAPYVMTQALRPHLAKAKNARVINTSSGAAQMAGDLKVDQLVAPSGFNKLNGPYAQSKLALSYWTYLLADDYQKEGIELCSVDPGGNKTKLTKGPGMPLLFLLLRPFIFKGPTHGAKLLYQAAFANAAAKDGLFLMKNKVVDLPIFRVQDEQREAFLHLVNSR